MKKSVLLVLSLIFILSGCGAKPRQMIYRLGKAYEYEKGGFSGIEDDKFIIYINDDGTFTYSEGWASSHLAANEKCRWEIEGDIITFTEDRDYGEDMVNRFKVESDGLVFIEEGSTNFIYTKVEDCDRFNLVTETDSIAAEE